MLVLFITGVHKTIAKFLTKDAKDVHTKSPFYRKYIKYDTIERAWHDFKATKPNSVRQCSRGQVRLTPSNITPLMQPTYADHKPFETYYILIDCKMHLKL